jgi:putative ABC transport system permease protein
LSKIILSKAFAFHPLPYKIFSNIRSAFFALGEFMIKHLFKLVWNRKRSNFLLIVEIFFSFLILFFVVTLAVYFADNYRQPLGFTYENVWHLSTGRQGSDDIWAPEDAATLEQVILAIKGFEEVEGVAGVLSPPYSFGSRRSVNEYNGREVAMEVNEVTDEFKDVMGLQLVAGRWFGKEDDGMNWHPLIINQRMAREWYGYEDPVDKQFEPWSQDGAEYRIIGVVTDFRKDGEYAGLKNYLFERRELGDPERRPPRDLVIKVRPGTNVAFEERLLVKLQEAARQWSFEIEPLSQARESSLRLRLGFVFGVGLVAAFLMLMVGLGLVGVLWQNVTQRTKEIGLRRAKGATASDIHRQILGELLVLTSFGLMAGVILVIQFPLLDLVGFISTQVYFIGLGISLLLIYGLTVAAGLYPSWLATRVQPAEALHYE